jgi:hypothetical protein
MREPAVGQGARDPPGSELVRKDQGRRDWETFKATRERLQERLARQVHSVAEQ